MKYQQLAISGPALSLARRRVGMSQVGLARRLGHTTPALVRDWERGHSSIPRAAYEAIGAAILAARLEQAQREQSRQPSPVGALDGRVALRSA